MIWHNKNCTPTFEQDEVSLIVWRDCGGKMLIEWIPYCPLRDGDWEKFVYDFRILYWSYEKDLLDQAQASEWQMSEKGFTPGPWTVGNPESINHTYPVYYGKDQECVCDVVYNKADAELIAAAPDLLHALEHAAHTLCVIQCASCLPQGSETGMAIFFREGCPRGSSMCDCAKWWEIIRKVVGTI